MSTNVQMLDQMSAHQLFSKAACMTLSLRKIGFTRRCKAKIKSKADQAMFRIMKSLISGEEYHRILKLDSQIRRQLHRFDLPAKVGKGMALVPAAALCQLSALIEDFRNQRAALIDAFIEAYPTRKEEARTKLAEQFKESEYPTIHEIRDSFRFDTQFIAFDLPESLKAIDTTLAEQEREKLMEKFRTYGEEIRDGLRHIFKESVDTLLDKLTPDEHGKSKRLRNSAITNLMQFLTSFEGNNISDDQELEKLVAQLRNTLQGVTPTQLRKDETFQSVVRTSLDSVRTQLNGLLIAKSPRRILISEDND
jgi:hypothetical protein